jgi:dsRNA-specific ribonuclease
LGDRRFHSAWGNNKKEAEQKAAYKALVELKVLEPLLDEDQ